MILPTVAMLNELVETAIEPHHSATASVSPAYFLNLTAEYLPKMG